MTSSAARTTHPLDRMRIFLSGGRFPVFALCLLFFYECFIATLIFSPIGRGPWSDFVEQFRVRCFQYNATSGGMDWSSAWTMLAEPLPIVVILFLFWHAPLRDFWRSTRRSLVPLAGSALLIVVLIAFSLVGLSRSLAASASNELPFPADRLRTSLPMPSFTLTDQDGRTVTLADFKGRIVLITAVYSACTTTCPMMLTKIRGVLDQLTPEERRGLAVVAFSLNPEGDTRELRSMTARLYGMESPQFHFINGIPSEVNPLLDSLGVVRTRDEKTGQIMHSNLFFLLDREGRIAYRLSLSQREQSWLGAAIRALLADESSPSV